MRNVQKVVSTRSGRGAAMVALAGAAVAVVLVGAGIGVGAMRAFPPMESEFALATALESSATGNTALESSATGNTALENSATRNTALENSATRNTALESGATSSIVFGRDVRPILSDRCFKCHGPDPATRGADLRLDVREDAVRTRSEKGKSWAAIVPGKSGASELVKRINSHEAAVVMPPAESGKKPLTAEEKALIARWIDEGAKYEAHWAFVTPKRPEVPKAAEGMGGVGEIDRFLGARAEAAGVKLSGEADKATLARRVFLDLTGLPPTPEETDAFVADGRADAYERLVDRLLTEEPYLSRHAERMAAPWLDQSRYADTCGIHMDAGRQMWLWRDWVIEAYRSNMRFDRFVTEQLAGDLIPEATEAQKIASGFNRNHVTTDEGGAIAEEYLVEYAVDRTSTVGSVMLGLTVGCARCHDHKFDPITAEDFYSLYAFFNSIEEPGLYSQEVDAQRAFEPFLVAPTAAQKTKLAELAEEVERLKKELEVRTPEEETQRRAFMDGLSGEGGVSWANAEVAGATATGDAEAKTQADRSVVIEGKNPTETTYTVTLKTEKTGLRAVSLEALLGANGKVGRAFNGNAVVSAVKVAAKSVRDGTTEDVKLMWVWADHAQPNGDYEVVNVIGEGRPNAAGWALQGYDLPGPRVALFVSEKPFGFEGGTEIVVTIEQRSMYAEHTLARVRADVGTISEAGLAMLPTMSSRWYVAGPFPGDEKNEVFEPEYGPEAGIDFAARYGKDKKQMWRFDERIADGRAVGFPDGRNAVFMGKEVYSTTARTVDVSLGSDDAWKLYVNGKEAAKRFVERGVMPDQDKATIELKPGRNTVVLKIANTGGPGGGYFKGTERASSATPLTGALVAAVLPEGARSGAEIAAKVDRAWREAFLPSFRERAGRLDAIAAEKMGVERAAPRTMVMKELAAQRETYVLARGQYDHPDKARKVERRIPTAFGKMAEGLPKDRLGLAGWITSPENPLLARVSVNKLWEMCFGSGLVRTTEDFGYQGEWPSHPELLDWLAVEFRESGWDVRHMLRLMVTSAAYKRSSVVRKDLAEKDPENRLLAFYPRRRLTAEQIRDSALYVSGLLKEQVGGASVKPYQPEGLWQEVAMPQSNTRIFERGAGDDLYRRSLYTYWKRAAPPPSMLTFDAPTRESCTIKRPSTNTPLQALVMWNDEQFVEAARVLAQRTLSGTGGDAARLGVMFRRCTGRAPDEKELAALVRALGDFRERFKGKVTEVEGLLKMGMAERKKDVEPGELAAWTMVASGVMNLHKAITQD